MENFNAEHLYDMNVVDETGDKIGTVRDIYLDDQTGNPSFITVGSLLGGTHTIPLTRAHLEDDQLRVPYSKSFIKDAPKATDAHISESEQDAIYDYYERSENSADGFLVGHEEDEEARREHRERLAEEYHSEDHRTLHDGDRHDHMDNLYADQEELTHRERATDTHEGNNSVTLHEEVAQVGTRAREAGHARLRKHVRTEQETVTVPVTHEEVRIERTPLEGHEVTDARLGEGEDVVVTLHEEEVVVDKDVVAKEEVRLDTEQVTEQVAVPVEVRKEEVSIEREGDGHVSEHHEGLREDVREHHDAHDLDRDGEGRVKASMGEYVEDAVRPEHPHDERRGTHEDSRSLKDRIADALGKDEDHPDRH